MHNFESLLVEWGEVVRVTLNRPDSRNSIDQALVSELHRVCELLEDEPRVLILTGLTEPDRGVFASGADLRQMIKRTCDDGLKGINSTVFQRIQNLPMPVIAAIDGWALGGGLELALAADIRIASDRAKFGQPETGLGLVAAAGAAWRLKELMGEGQAAQLVFTGEIISAPRAHELGLVNSVVPADDLADSAITLANTIAEKDPRATRLMKTVLKAPREAHPVIDNMAQAIAFESEGKNDRIGAFLNKSAKK